MNRFVLIVVSALVLVLSACGGGSSTTPTPTPTPTPTNQLAGKYNGETADNTIGSFALVTFTINDAGSLTGTTTAKDLGDAPEGEKGTITGTLTINNVGLVEANITLESPSIGKFTIEKMSGAYLSNQLSISGGSVKDANGTFVGQFGVINATKE